MVKDVNEIIKNLPPERQKKIELRAKELRAEYLTLQNLRKARGLTQEELAERLEMRQDGISRLENRPNLSIATLRTYIEAMGGELELIARFPDQQSVVLTGLSELQDDSENP
jgi:transcriptional regulator with XRE-family HTH domain